MAEPVPKGPLAARFAGLDPGVARAGAIWRASVEVENAGTVAWRSENGIHVAYHFLDDRGNPIFWDGVRTPLPHAIAPGERARVELEVQGPLPPGRYRFAVDLVAEGRAWFGELGGYPIETDVEVLPRTGRRLAVVGGDPGAFDAQEEPVVADPEEADAVAHVAPGFVPAPDWSRRVLDAHQEGYGVVGGSIDAGRRRRSAFAPWKPGGGRVPGFPHPLLCPSVARDARVEWLTVEGLPAARATPPDRFYSEPSLFDARITARLRSGRRRG